MRLRFVGVRDCGIARVDRRRGGGVVRYPGAAGEPAAVVASGLRPRMAIAGVGEERIGGRVARSVMRCRGDAILEDGGVAVHDIHVGARVVPEDAVPERRRTRGLDVDGLVLIAVAAAAREGAVHGLDLAARVAAVRFRVAERVAAVGERVEDVRHVELAAQDVDSAAVIGCHAARVARVVDDAARHRGLRAAEVDRAAPEVIGVGVVGGVVPAADEGAVRDGDLRRAHHHQRTAVGPVVVSVVVARAGVAARVIRREVAAHEVQRRAVDETERAAAEGARVDVLRPVAVERGVADRHGGGVGADRAAARLRIVAGSVTVAIDPVAREHAAVDHERAILRADRAAVVDGVILSAGTVLGECAILDFRSAGVQKRDGLAVVHGPREAVGDRHRFERDGRAGEREERALDEGAPVHGLSPDDGRAAHRESDSRVAAADQEWPDAGRRHRGRLKEPTLLDADEHVVRGAACRHRGLDRAEGGGPRRTVARAAGRDVVDFVRRLCRERHRAGHRRRETPVELVRRRHVPFPREERRGVFGCADGHRVADIRIRYRSGRREARIGGHGDLVLDAPLPLQRRLIAFCRRKGALRGILRAVLRHRAGSIGVEDRQFPSVKRILDRRGLAGDNRNARRDLHSVGHRPAAVSGKAAADRFAVLVRRAPDPEIILRFLAAQEHARALVLVERPLGHIIESHDLGGARVRVARAEVAHQRVGLPDFHAPELDPRPVAPAAVGEKGQCARPREVGGV